MLHCYLDFLELREKASLFPRVSLEDYLCSEAAAAAALSLSPGSSSLTVAAVNTHTQFRSSKREQ